MIKYYDNLSLESLFYINNEGLVCYEEWKDIVGYENFYQISTLGRVKSLERYRIHKKRGKELINNRILKQTKSNKTRLFVSLWKNRKNKVKSVSLIMGEIFFNHKYCPIKKELIDHINNNSLDNRLENLQVITNRKNSTKDKKPKSKFNGVYKSKNKFRATITFNNKSYTLGYSYSAEKAHNWYLEAVKLIENNQSFEHLINQKSDEKVIFYSKLNEKEVLEIRRLYSLKNTTQKKIAEKYGVTTSNISDIVNRKTWKHI